MLAARGLWFEPRSTGSRGDNPKVALAHSGSIPVPNLAFDIACGPIFIEAQLNKNDLYVVNPMYLNLPNAEYNYRAYDAMATKAEAFDLLHKTLGHLAYDRLVHRVKEGRVP